VIHTKTRFKLKKKSFGFDEVVRSAFITRDKIFYSFIAFAIGENTNNAEQIIQSIWLK
jgi:hypothetical protein